jgi:hypothetical protein
MHKISRFAVYFAAVCIACLPPVGTAWSADEDMISQVYLEFDPETGEFKTALDPTAQGTNQHAQTQQLHQIQQAQDQLAGQQATAAGTAGDSSGTAAGNAGAVGSGSNQAILFGVIIAIVLLGGSIVWKRKGQQN